MATRPRTLARGTRRFLLAAAVLAGAGSAGGARALTLAGFASSNADGGAPQYVTITQPVGTTGPTAVDGTCSHAGCQAWIDIPGGAAAVSAFSDGAPFTGCVAHADAHGAANFSDDYRVESATLPEGTPVDLALCLRADLRQGAAFGCGNVVFEGINKTATLRVTFASGQAFPQATGGHGERWDCFDSHDFTLTGMFAPGPRETTLTLSQVPVGSLVRLDVVLEIAASVGSFTAHDVSHLETALVFGCSASGDARLVSTVTAAEMSPASNCSAAHLAAVLPAAPALTLDAPAPAAGSGLALAPPAPNPVRTGTRVAFRLPSAGVVDLAVFDVAGARVATLERRALPAGEHEVAWAPSGGAGQTLRPGLYWLRLRASGGTLNRPLVVR